MEYAKLGQDDSLSQLVEHVSKNVSNVMGVNPSSKKISWCEDDDKSEIWYQHSKSFGRYIIVINKYAACVDYVVHLKCTFEFRGFLVRMSRNENVVRYSRACFGTGGFIFHLLAHSHHIL